MIIGFLFEVIGVHTGFPFGKYRYVELGIVRILDVSLGVPIMWGIYAVISFLTASLYASGIRLVLFTAFLTILIDLQLDPLMVSYRAWVWEGS